MKSWRFRKPATIRQKKRLDLLLAHSFTALPQSSDGGTSGLSDMPS